MSTETAVIEPKETKAAKLTIAPPNMQVLHFRVKGTSPYVQNKFSAKARQMMKDKQEAGSTAKKGAKKEGKDFQECYEGAMYRSAQGWHGIPAASFRNAMISACRVVGFQMTRAKLAVFVEADGIDPEDGTQLVKLTKGTPQYFESLVRLETGVADIRPRPMWPEWECEVRVRFDGDMFTRADVMNLLARAGMQVGVGEGRPDSKNSAGMGWGCFTVEPVLPS